MGASYPDIVFLSFDTYNPPTPSHFRIFEVAKDHFEQINKCHVILGIIVPTDFESKGEAEIVSLHHRIAMIELFLKSSVWIQLSDKVCTKGGSNSIKYILQAHQNVINNVIKASASDKQIDRPSWLPQDLQFKGKVQVKFLGAADILEKYFAPKEKQAENVLKEILENNGLVVVSNSGLYCEKFIFYSDLLSMHKQNITLVTNWASNNVTSSLIRRLLSRGQSVKYLLDDAVINYINDNKLYMHFYVSNTEHKLPQMLPTLKIKASDAIAFQYKPEFSYISSEEKNKSQEKTRKHPLPCNEDLSEFLKFAIETKRIKAVRREQYFV